MNADQKRRADKIMKLLMSASPSADIVVLAHVLAAFMLTCPIRNRSAETICDTVDLMMDDAKTVIRLVLASPSGGLQ